MNNENISSEKSTQYKKTKQYISQNCVLKTTMISNDLKKKCSFERTKGSNHWWRWILNIKVKKIFRVTANSSVVDCSQLKKRIQTDYNESV